MDTRGNLLIKGASVLLGDNFERADLLIEDGIITNISPTIPDIPDTHIIDMSGVFVMPGLIDVHTHGAIGIDVARADAAELGALSKFYASQGTTGWLASLFTDTEEGLNSSIDTIRAYMDSNPSGARILGIHLEGPFAAHAHSGVFPEHLLREGDYELFDRLRKRAGGLLKYITLAPEVAGVAEMIAPMRDSGVVVSLGHTGADYETSMQAIKDGATSITHTFNAMKIFDHHAPAIIGAALESDVYCEAICDGFHLHPGTVRMMLKIKGYDRIVAISDSNMAAGMPDGRYKINDVEIIVENGDAKSALNGRRAASTLTMIKALQNLKEFTGQPISKLSKLLSANPATMLGIDKHKGRIEKGFDADLILLDKTDQIIMTIVGGCVV